MNIKEITRTRLPQVAVDSKKFFDSLNIFEGPPAVYQTLLGIKDTIVMTGWILEKRPKTCILDSKYMKMVGGRMAVRPALLRLTAVSA